MYESQSELIWLDERETVGLLELSQVCGLTGSELMELVEYGALVPVDRNTQQFSAACVAQLRTAAKLRVDFELDVFTVSVLMGYLDRIDSLERKIAFLNASSATHSDSAP